MSQIRKSSNGFFIPKELIADFEHAEVDTSHPHAIVIRSPARQQELTPYIFPCPKNAAVRC
jgi:hypothetical protein